MLLKTSQLQFASRFAAVPTGHTLSSVALLDYEQNTRNLYSMKDWN